MPELLAEPGEVPEPSVELLLLRVFAESYVATAPRKRGERFLRTVGEKLAKEVNLSAAIPIRPTSGRASMMVAQKQAAEVYLRWLPTFLARVGDG